MIKYLLDTNICIYVIKRRPIEALSRFNDAAGHLAISSVTLAELLHGVEKSQQVAKNMLAVEDFYSRLDVLEYGEQAAFHYGGSKGVIKGGQIQIKSCKDAGEPPSFDIAWVII